MKRRTRTPPHQASDVATRARLLDAAKRLFSERGFEDVTVRDICREAKANLALVSYYFGDKQGLYREVVDEAITLLTAFDRLSMQVPEGSSAEDKLRHFVRVFLSRVVQPAPEERWVHELMQRETDRPTGAAGRVGRLAVAPRIRYLFGVVADLLGCPPDDPRVGPCVGSVYGLCLIFIRMRRVPAAFRNAVPELSTAEPPDIEAATEHVVRFSLAGIRAMTRPPSP